MKNYIIPILTILLLSATFVNSQERVKIATYNLLNYPNNTATKNPKFQLIMDEMNPDILVVQEILSQTAVNEFLNEVLSDEYEAGDFINGPDTDNAIFFKDSLFQFISTEFIAPSQGPRYIS
ncbi:MAG: endonuclease/exonuclease/phosphatase family protein, partial [Ignavibacteriaceae bacterium]